MKFTARPISRILWLIAACGGAAIAVTALSFSMNSTSAQAAERPAGLLDDLSSVVDSATSTVASTAEQLVDGVASTAGQLVDGVVNEVVVPVAQSVTSVVPAVTAPVVETVPQVVEPVVDIVATVPVVGPEAAEPVTNTANEVTDAVGETAAAVSDALASDPLAKLTDPLRSDIHKIPVVGKLVGALSPLLDPVVAGADKLLGVTGNAVDDVATPFIEVAITPPHTPQNPGVVPGVEPDSDTAAQLAPGEDARSGPEGPDALAADARGPSLLTDAALAQGRTVSNIAQNGEFATVPQGGEGSTAPISDATHVPLAPAPPQSSSAGAGGGSAGALAAIVDADSLRLRAVVLTAGASDDDLPASPVFDTDISPD